MWYKKCPKCKKCGWIQASLWDGVWHYFCGACGYRWWEKYVCNKEWNSDEENGYVKRNKVNSCK